MGNDKAHGYNETNPDYVLDEYGRFQPAVNRFPSAAGGKGFKPIADYIHNTSLIFNINIMSGVPLIGVQRKLSVKGANITPADIYSDKDLNFNFTTHPMSMTVNSNKNKKQEQ